MACIDDLFIRFENRNQGLCTEALMNVREICTQKKARAITVEVALDNGPAQAVYRRIGMTAQPGRQILIIGLAKPTHKVEHGA